MHLGRGDFLKIDGTVAVLGSVEGKIVFKTLKKDNPVEADALLEDKHGVCVKKI